MGWSREFIGFANKSSESINSTERGGKEITHFTVNGFGHGTRYRQKSSADLRLHSFSFIGFLDDKGQNESARPASALVSVKLLTSTRHIVTNSVGYVDG